MKKDSSLIIKPVMTRAELRRDYKLAGKWETYCLFCMLPDCSTEQSPNCLIRQAKIRAGLDQSRCSEWEGWPDGYITVGEIAERLGLIRGTINRWILEEGLGEDFIEKQAGRWLIPEELVGLFEERARAARLSGGAELPAGYISVGEIAERLGKSRQTIIHWINRGVVSDERIEKFKGRWLIPEELVGLFEERVRKTK